MLERKTNNPLLVKSGIGRSKPATVRLPPPDFVYGKVYNRDADEDMFVKKGPKINWPKTGAQQDHMSVPIDSSKV
jgi:hypothetical protein